MHIQRLNADVVHKIAAGEIIISPANALKELLENSIDSGASNIGVVVKEGGFKLLQVIDNGSGIAEEDLPLLCERFSTSKITNFSDLATIATLGFRGEALASISHIAHLSVRTMKKDSKMAVQTAFASGNMLYQPKPCAGLNGTQITVEDLFYNVPQRKKALRAGDEYQKILDVVTRYAIHYTGTDFTCQRDSDTTPVVISGATHIDRIRRVWDSSLAKNILEVNIQSHPALGLESAKGLVTGLNYYSKKAFGFILFVNNRLVSSETLSRSIRKLYASFLPKGERSFVYLSLQVTPQNLDVNVHPTKREVQFLYEAEIVEIICDKISERLRMENSGRDFSVQSFITSTSLPSESVPTSSSSNYATTTASTTPRQEYRVVRTDPKQPKISAFSRETPQIDETPAVLSGSEEMRTQSNEDLPHIPSSNREPRKIELSSLDELRAEIRQEAEPRLTRLLAEHTFVGIVDAGRGLAAVQYDVRLYLLDYHELTAALVYQRCLSEFGNFGTISLGDGLSLTSLLNLAQIDVSAGTFDGICSMSDMLQEYFEISIRFQEHEDPTLVQLPHILPGVHPCFARLPAFVADLIACDWSNEKECLRGVMKALAALYVPFSQASSKEVENIFELSKLYLIAPRSLLPCVVEIANLPGLYRVFERC